MAEYTKLRNVTNAQTAELSTVVLQNFISFYDWGYLDKGGYYNVNIPQSGLYGGSKHILKAVDDPNYTKGQVWQANRTNWVWETGVSVGTPVRISGVFITGVFRATGNTQQPYFIDYKNGRIVLDTAISVSSNVQLSYSNKWLNVIPAKGVPWFREIQRGANRVDNTTFTYGSGDWVQLGQTRVQIPTLAIDIVPSTSTKGYQLGGGQWVRDSIMFYVITENYTECLNIIDQIVAQNDGAIYLYDPNRVVGSGHQGLNYRGELNPNALPSGLYETIIDNHFYNRCYITNSIGQGVTELAPNLYIGVAKCTTEVGPK